MNCKKCGIDKEVTEFYKSTSKFGYDKTCKVCRAEIRKVKPKVKKSKKSKYRPVRKLINPEHPIPVKLVSEDGFGGKWKFDIEQLKKRVLNWTKENGQKNHMVKRSSKCWQVKTDDFDKIITFCDSIMMSRKAIIEFPKADKSVYVVNLYHPRILEIVR